MIRELARRWKSLLVVLLAVSIVTWIGQVAASVYAKDEAKKMAHEINQIKTQTVCVGRFLIDVPADALISYRPAFLSGWSIYSDAEETDAAFAERLSATETKHQGAKNERGESSLELVKIIDAGGAFGKIFVHSRFWTHGFENGKRVDSTFAAVDASVRIRGVSFDLAMEIGDEEDVKELVQLIPQLEPRPDNAIPSKSGFCFDRALLRDPLTAGQNERVSVSIGLKGHPDVAIALNTMAGLNPDPGLLQRDDENNVKQSNRSNFKTVRKGKRSIGGVPGEEVLDLVIEPNGTRSQLFMWESLSQKDSVYLPELIWEMHTGHGEPGNPINSSLTDARALALWDRISGSLRLRLVQPVAAEGSLNTPPVGTHARAAEKCVRSGWWQCDDGGDGVDIVGGRRQYFTEGQVLPQAVLLTPATLWQNFRGEKPTFISSIPSSWKLVDRRKAARNPSSAFLAEALPPAEASIDDGQAVPYNPEVVTGALVMSTAACPASGWWECMETKALDGTRWFSRGHLMPPATMPVSINLVDKIKGRPEFARVMASWRLVRAANASSPLPSDSAQLSAPGDSKLERGHGADDPATGPTEDA